MNRNYVLDKHLNKLYKLVIISFLLLCSILFCKAVFSESQIGGKNISITSARITDLETTVEEYFISTATGLSYSSGVFSLTTGYVIPTTTEESNWNTAYGWGNHASAGYFIKASDDLDDITAGTTNVHLTTTLKSNYDAAYSHKTTEDALSGLVKVDGAGSYTAITLDTDNTLNSNSDTRVNSQKAVKAYIDRQYNSLTSSAYTTNGNPIVIPAYRWQYNWDWSVLPASYATVTWTRSTGGSGSTEAVSGYVLSIADTSSGYQYYNYGSFATTDIVIVENQCKVTSNQTGANAEIIFSLRDGTNIATLTGSNSYIYYNGTQILAIDNTVVHTYRMEKIRASRVNIYADNVLVYTTTSFGASATNGLYFGSGSTLGVGSMDSNYIRLAQIVDGVPTL